MVFLMPVLSCTSWSSSMTTECWEPSCSRTGSWNTGTGEGTWVFWVCSSWQVYGRLHDCKAAIILNWFCYFSETQEARVQHCCACWDSRCWRQG
jgi:hypothetical protein